MFYMTTETNFHFFKSKPVIYFYVCMYNLCLIAYADS